VFARSFTAGLYGSVVGLLVYGAVGALGGLVLGLVLYLTGGFGLPADRSRDLFACPVLGLAFAGLGGLGLGAVAGARIGLERWPSPFAIIRATWAEFASSVKRGHLG
jgi:hypothetical protein